ncbi:MAG: hypothetical protein R2911_35480 [Caldilineaceae bacterium]
MNVDEIESAINQLPTREMDRLVDWLEEHYGRVWSEEAEAEHESTELDALLAQIEARRNAKTER